MAVASCYHYGGHYGNDHHYGGGHTVHAAVLSNHHVSYHDVHSHPGHIKPTTIEVPPHVLPVNFIFRSASSHIHASSKHEGAPGSHKETSSHDEPHKLMHTVYKPIYQEVKEVISPYRRIVQKVEPVKEDIQTIVARGHHDYHHKPGYESDAGHMAGYGDEKQIMSHYGGAYGDMAAEHGKY